jgi:hypothetical protein
VDSYLSWTADQEQPVVIKIEARGGSYGSYDFICQIALPPAGPPTSPGPVAGPPPAPIPLSATTMVTTTASVSLPVRYVGPAAVQAAAPTTHIRLLVFYDAKNDRQPGPGEGIANVSVLAVDARGQRLARVFTNAQGEAVFNLAGDSITRVIVPFVPGWSARVRVGEVNDDIVLGLPAVRLPVFLPVQTQTALEE